MANRFSYSSKDELDRILKLFDSCQDDDDFETTVQSAEDKWRGKLNNAAEYRLCRMRFDRGSYPVAVPDTVINNVRSIRLGTRVTTVLQNERIVVRITGRQPATSPVADGVIEGRYSIDEKYSMLSRAKIGKILLRKPRNFRACRLQLEGAQQGWAVPLELSDDLEKVELKGRSNCGRACQGDTVLVEVLDKDEDNTRLGHGRVVGVLKQHDKLLYKLFVCELIYDEGTFMRPLCNTFPKIGYDNRHAREWYRAYYEKSVRRNQHFQQRRAAGVQNREEIVQENIEKYANLHYVSVYNPRKRFIEDKKGSAADGQKKGKKGQDARLKEKRGKFVFDFTAYDMPLHVQKHSCDKLFVVCYLGWSVNQFYPSGKVVHVFDRVDSMESTLETLLLKHSLPRKVVESPPVKRDLEKVTAIATDTSDHASRVDYRSHFTITIDNPDTKDMDDAISFQYNERTRMATIGVHITDVSYYIEKDSNLDKLGRNRVVTVYPPRIAKLAGVTPNHLFPSALSESLLSLVEGKDRRCLSMIFEFKRDPTGEWDLRKRTPAMTLIRSNYRLNKDTVQEILLGRLSDSNGYNVPELISPVRYLWSIAKELRVHRMGSAAFVLADRLEEPEAKIGDKFEASALVEEFMVLANRSVGEFLASSKYLEPFVNRVQEPPRDVEVEVWRRKFDPLVTQSAVMTRHFRNLSIGLDHSAPRSSVRIFKDDSRLLKQLCHKDPRGAALMLFSEARFPSLFLAISDWHRISKPASYVEFRAQPPNVHYDLNIENYVHFTSPLRRYPDILVHRALRAQLEGRIQGKVDPIEDLADHMTSMVQRSKRYEKDCRCFEFAELNKTKPQCLLAIVRELNDDEIVFTSTAFDFLPTVSKTMPLRFFSLSERPVVGNNSTSLRLQWKKKVFCHPGSERYNLFLAEGIQPGKNSEVLISSSEYFDFVEYEQAVGIKNQLAKCQGNYDDVRQLCERSANRIVVEPDKTSSKFVVSSESRLQETSIMNSSSHIVREFQTGDIMRVQFYNVMNHGLLTPTIQMIELCDTVDVCAAHRMRPVVSFERTAEESSLDAYQDAQHYTKLWLPIIAMESATIAAAADDSLIVHDVELKWQMDAKNNRLLGLFCLTEQYCQNRLIRFSDSVYFDPKRREKLEEYAITRQMKDPTEEAFAVGESMSTLRYAEYICLRSRRDSYTWIGHGGILCVYITPHASSSICGVTKPHICRFIVFHLNDVSCDPRVPQESLTRATIEIIYKFLPSRRQEIAVQMLGDALHSFGLAEGLIRLETEGRRCNSVTADWTTYLTQLNRNGIRRYVIRIPNERSEQKMDTIPCNESQERAISKAMTSPVTLIWGPPGTGKTSTGIMLTYWYVFVNRCLDDTWHEADNYYDVADDDDDDDEEEVGAADDRVTINYAGMGLPTAEGDGGRKNRRQARLVEQKVQAVKAKQKKGANVQTRRQVLYCGPSNASVDVVATYLLDKLRVRCPRIVRVASEQIEQRKYPVPGEGPKSKVNAETQISPMLENVTLHEIIRIGNGKRARLLKSFDHLFRRFLARKWNRSTDTFTRLLMELLPNLPDLQRCLQSHLDEYALLTNPERNEPLQPHDMDLSMVVSLYRRALSDAKKAALQRFEVVLCTTSVSSSGLLQKACKFNQIIIDEAGMCTQPETLVPIVGYIKAAAAVAVDEDDSPVPIRLASHHAERVVLIGDHKQLCPIIQNKTAALLGLRKSFMEYHTEDTMVMLQYQYRMHPSLADFPAEYFYNVNGFEARPTPAAAAAAAAARTDGVGLQTRCSNSWTGLRRFCDIRRSRREWNGLNNHLLAEEAAYNQMAVSNANILHGRWPGVRTREQCVQQGYVYSTMPQARPEELHPMGEEERAVFLHIAGKERRTTVATDEGHEDSRCNDCEARTAVRIYKCIVDRLHSRRFSQSTIGVLSQYRYQVSLIKKMLAEEGFHDATVQTVIASQGSEFDYVILSLVRSLPDYEIPKCPLPGWENRYLGFITDENQINVALTRARRGLIMIGNRSLLRTNRMWSCLLDSLERRGCVPAHADDFPDRTGDRRQLSRDGRSQQQQQQQQFYWREDQDCFWPRSAPREYQRSWAPTLAAAAAGATGATQQQQQQQHLRRPFSVCNDEDFPALR